MQIIKYMYRHKNKLLPTSLTKALILHETRCHHKDNMPRATNNSLKQIGPVIWANTPETIKLSKG